MDVMLYALVLGQVQREMHLSAAISGAMMSATLVSAAVGGLGFGWFADRFGRVRALTGSILIYSVATALCGLTHSAGQLMLCRVILGLGMGGEWASGAALVAETWPAQHRGKALALVQSSWAIGFALGAAVVALIMPRFGWRAVFFAGIAPAPPHPLVSAQRPRAGILETGAHSARPLRPAVSRRPRPRHARLRHHERRHPLRLVGFVHLGATLPLHAHRAGWPRPQHCRHLALDHRHAGRNLPRLRPFRLHRRPLRSQVHLHRLSPRRCRARPLLRLRTQPATPCSFIGPLIGFFGTGYFSGFSVIASELFPTALRGTAMGFVYNIGRVTSALAPWLIGRFSESAGLSAALCLTSAAFLLAAIIATALHLPKPAPA